MAVLSCLAALLAGCASGTRAGIGDGRLYPQGKPQTGVLGVQVTRDETVITLTNTSARSFGPSTLWLNRQWSRDIDAFPIGGTLTLDLSGFTNEHGERFRAGGFFATERPDVLVQAQIETGDDLLGLVVISDTTRR